MSSGTSTGFLLQPHPTCPRPLPFYSRDTLPQAGCSGSRPHIVPFATHSSAGELNSCVVAPLGAAGPAVKGVASMHLSQLCGQ